ncbi:uncharacterized protein LOC130049163 [Ostrea edulis]|uniref:uncharacterized protein LOC130049163 n=1 Tax=Ostrea edulis TaxID=37623 RepID=UPI0024AFBA3D|nr:uncharacterized protein LOC130049163 [Ostrea edulis]
MSDEEDALYLLLQDDPYDHAFSINMLLTSQSLVESFQVSSASDSLLANPDMYWKDADVEGTGAPDPRSVALHSEQRQPGKLIWDPIIQRTADFMKLVLANDLVFSICVTTNHYADMVIFRGRDCHMFPKEVCNLSLKRICTDFWALSYACLLRSSSR